jgi:hypothetical protein
VVRVSLKGIVLVICRMIVSVSTELGFLSLAVLVSRKLGLVSRRIRSRNSSSKDGMAKQAAVNW